MKAFYKQLPSLIKLIWRQLHRKSNFYKQLIFDAVIDLPNSRKIIAQAPTTDIFIDDNLFSGEDIEDDSKQIIFITF